MPTGVEMKQDSIAIFVVVKGKGEKMKETRTWNRHLMAVLVENEEG